MKTLYFPHPYRWKYCQPFQFVCSGGCVVVSTYTASLYFLSNYWCWMSLLLWYRYVCEYGHICHVVYVEVKRKCQVLVLSFHFVWDRVSVVHHCCLLPTSRCRTSAIIDTVLGLHGFWGFKLRSSLYPLSLPSLFGGCLIWTFCRP